MDFAQVATRQSSRMGKEENPIYALFNTNLHEKTKDGSEK